MGNWQTSLSTIMMVSSCSTSCNNGHPNDTPTMQLYVSPIAMSAQIFSTQENLMPFIPRNFGTFAVLTFIFGVATHFILKYQDQPVQLRGKLRAPTTQLLCGNVSRFCAVCRDTLHLILRLTVMYGATIHTTYAQVVRSCRRLPNDALDPRGEELEMALPLRRDIIDMEYLACPTSDPIGSAERAVEPSHAV